MTTASGQTVGLVMIVKNESKVIRRCLESVRDLIDNWTIVDTGSTDGTQKIIKDYLKKTPGALHERPWVDFGFNRTELIKLARDKSDYMLMIDADEVITKKPKFKFPNLTADGYMTLRETKNGTNFYLIQLLRSKSDWRYEGVLHEVAMCNGPKIVEKLDGLKCTGFFDSARNHDPEKYMKDVQVLEKELEKEPNNTRNAFYLAQSYKDAGLLQKAINMYTRRMSMGGWDEEIWYSAYQVGCLLERLGKLAESNEAYLKAYEMRPSRAEPLCDLSRRYRVSGNYHTSYIFASRAAEIKHPQSDILFVDSTVYAWRALDELSISAYYIGEYEKSLTASDAMINSKKVPENELSRITANRQFSLDKVGSETEVLKKPRKTAAKKSK